MIMLETSERVYVHRCLTHANYRASNKRREKDEWWQERKEMPSILVLSNLLWWWRCSVPHSLYVSFTQSYMYTHRSTVNRFKSIDVYKRRNDKRRRIDTYTRLMSNVCFYKYSSLNVKYKWIEKEICYFWLIDRF
jgi:hypothetical protein